MSGVLRRRRKEKLEEARRVWNPIARRNFSLSGLAADEDGRWGARQIDVEELTLQTKSSFSSFCDRPPSRSWKKKTTTPLNDRRHLRRVRRKLRRGGMETATTTTPPRERSDWSFNGKEECRG